MTTIALPSHSSGGGLCHRLVVRGFCWLVPSDRGPINIWVIEAWGALFDNSYNSYSGSHQGVRHGCDEQNNSNSITRLLCFSGFIQHHKSAVMHLRLNYSIGTFTWMVVHLQLCRPLCHAISDLGMVL